MNIKLDATMRKTCNQLENYIHKLFGIDGMLNSFEIRKFFLFEKTTLSQHKINTTVLSADMFTNTDYFAPDSKIERKRSYTEVPKSLSFLNFDLTMKMDPKYFDSA